MPPRWLFSVLLASCVVNPLAAQQTANELRAERDWKRLTERFADDKADREKLRQDVLTFHRTYPGTSKAIKAAEMLRQLPSPLDHLDPAKIRPLEVFSWQPKQLVAVLGEHRGRQAGPATCVAYSPDRKFIASGGAHLVRLWETDPKRLLRLIVNLSAPNCYCLAISPDSKLLAAGGQGTIYVYELDGKDNKLRVSIPAGSTAISSVAFDPKGKPLLACGGADNKVRLFDLDKHDPKQMELIVLTKHQQPVTSVAFSPDGVYLASGSAEGAVRLWKLEGAKTDEAAKIDANAKGVTSLAYSKDGRVLAAGCADGTIMLWTMAAAKATPRAAFTGHGGAVASLAFASHGNTLTSAGADALIRQWDVAKKTPTKSAEFKGHAGGATGVAYSPDGSSLASSSSDWTVRVWDLATKRERVPPDGPLSVVYGLAFSTDAATLATGSYDHFVRLASVSGDAPRERSAFAGSGSYVYSLAYAPDGRTLASGEYAGVVHFWNVVNVARPQPAGQIKDLPGYVYNLAYTSDGGRILIQHHPTASLFDVRSRSRIHQFEADPKGKGLAGVALSPDGSRIAGTSGNYLMKGNDYVKNKDGSYVYFDNHVRLWDADSGKLLHKEALVLPAYGVGFAPDGRQLATGGWNETLLHFWDVSDGSLKEKDNVPTPHYVYRIQYSLDGRYILTQDSAYRILIWDAGSRKKLHEFALNESVGQATFACDSRHLALSLGTGVTYILRLEGTARSVVR
jgi:WD40 repeat protein